MQPTPDPSNHPRQGSNSLQACLQENQELKIQVEDLRNRNATITTRNNALEARHIQDLAEYHSQLQTKDGDIEAKEETIRQRDSKITRLKHDINQQRRKHKTECKQIINRLDIATTRLRRRHNREFERLERRHAVAKDIQEARIRRGIAANNGRDWDNGDGAVAAPETMWYDDLREEGEDNTSPESYALIWKKSHVQGNMSYRTLHPDLKLWKGPSNRIRRRPQAQLAPEQPFNFAGLPPNVQAQIFRICLQKNNIIHCISRLSTEPGQTPIDYGNSSRFPHVFFWKSPQQPCAIHLAPRPADVLELLLVCKDWLHMGATCFYSMNTFAFSSFGEFDRFGKGSGLSRMQRVQSIELMHIGSHMKKDGNNNARTRPLQLLPLMVRLSHLTLYVDEGWGYRRRRYEEVEVQKSLIDATKLQENKRLRRSIRTIQGMDYYYSRRGIEQFEVYDISKAGRKQAITDQSALVDLHHQVKTPKLRTEEYKARLENLEPFLTPSRGWAPSHAVRTTCRHFFNPPPEVYREPLRPRPMGGLGNDSPNDGGNDDGNNDGNNDYPRDDDSRDRREDSGYHSSAAQLHDRDRRQGHRYYPAPDDDSGHGSDGSDDNDDQSGPRFDPSRQRLWSVFPDAGINSDQPRIPGSSIFPTSETTHNRSQLQGNQHHGQSGTPIIIGDNEDDNDRPRFRGTLRQDRSETHMFVTDDEDDDSYSVDDSFLNAQTDRYGVPRSVLSELQSSIEFEDDEREIKKEHFSDDGMLNDQVIDADSIDDDEREIKMEYFSDDGMLNESVIDVDSMESDGSVIVLWSREASPDLDDFIIKVEAATFDDPVIIDEDDEDSGEVKRGSSNKDGNSSTIKSEGSSSATAICVNGDEEESEVNIKSEITNSVTDDMRAFSLRNIDLSAGQGPHDPVNLTLDPPPHDMESRVSEAMETLDSSSSVSIQPHDSASNVATTIAGSILYTASAHPTITHNDSRHELFEASQELSEAGDSTKRTALAHHDGDRRASKRQRSEAGPECSSDL